ncbi:MAG: hypothetical protein JO023_21925 [Chloroflexi bacterium]|nr:hypothetical protein [Chloroflexota bacterium]
MSTVLLWSAVYQQLDQIHADVVELNELVQHEPVDLAAGSRRGRSLVRADRAR